MLTRVDGHHGGRRPVPRVRRRGAAVCGFWRRVAAGQQHAGRAAGQGGVKRQALCDRGGGRRAGRAARQRVARAAGRAPAALLHSQEPQGAALLHPKNRKVLPCSIRKNLRVLPYSIHKNPKVCWVAQLLPYSIHQNPKVLLLVLLLPCSIHENPRCCWAARLPPRSMAALLRGAVPLSCVPLAQTCCVAAQVRAKVGSALADTVAGAADGALASLDVAALLRAHAPLNPDFTYLPSTRRGCAGARQGGQRAGGHGGPARPTAHGRR